MTGYGKTRQSLQAHRLAPKKRFGQNFLVHRHTAEAIVRAGGVQADDVIVEVGVGLGALTLPLAAAARQVVGLEIDSGIIRFHQQEQDLPDNVLLCHQDVLKADFSDLARRFGGRLKIMANLPYSISNPFLFKLIDNREHMAWATIMLQKEVAMRLAAEPGSKEYGVPTILLQSCATVTPRMVLKPEEFHPRPKIESVVVRIDFSPEAERLKNLPPYDHHLFRTLVRAAFSQRRKTLLNTLSRAECFTAVAESADIKALVGRMIEAAGITFSIRAEELVLEDFIRLTVEAERLLTAPQPTTQEK